MATQPSIHFFTVYCSPLIYPELAVSPEPAEVVEGLFTDLFSLRNSHHREFLSPLPNPMRNNAQLIYFFYCALLRNFVY
jgi:hypothetical protein